MAVAFLVTKALKKQSTNEKAILIENAQKIKTSRMWIDEIVTI